MIVGGMFQDTTLLFLYAAVCTRSVSRAVSVGLRGIALGRFFGGLRTRASFSIICQSVVLDRGPSMIISTSGHPLGSVLSRMLRGRNLSCGIDGGAVIVIGTRTRTPIGRQGAGGVSNIVASRANLPMTKTGVMIGKAAGKAVSSVSKGFSLRTTPKRVLRVSCVNFLPVRMGVSGGGAFSVLVGRSTRNLSRIIIVNCNAMGGESLAKTITSIGTTGVSTIPASATSRTLRKHVPKIIISGTG